VHSLARHGRIVVVALLVLALACSGVAAQEVGEDDAGEDGEELLSVSGWVAVGAFLLGAVILLVSVEVLIHAMVKTATRFGVSALLLAIVVSGTEVDNVAFGVFTGFREMQNVAFGLAIGNAISIFGLTLAVAAIAYPFEVSVPDDYLALMVASPLLLVPFLLIGTITALHGVGLVLAYVLIFAYIARRELRGDRSYMRSAEVMEAATSADGEGQSVEGQPADGQPVGGENLPDPLRGLTRSDWFWPVVMVVALLGIVVGAESASAGTEGILRTWDLQGTIVGVTLVTILFTLDDLLLAVEPVRLGYYDVAVGGIIGSLLFFVTANTGIVAVVGSISTSSRAILFHLPALLVMAALSGYLFRRGRVTRRAGIALLGLYVVYLAVNVLFFAGVPVDG
jgi:cation:H+ antiporter